MKCTITVIPSTSGGSSADAVFRSRFWYYFTRRARLGRKMIGRRAMERRSFLLPNGYYYLRPGGRWGAAFEVDKTTRHRWVRYQNWFNLATLAFMFVIINISYNFSFDTMDSILLSAVSGATIFLLGRIGSKLVLRGARRIPPVEVSESIFPSGSWVGS